MMKFAFAALINNFIARQGEVEAFILKKDAPVNLGEGWLDGHIGPLHIMDDLNPVAPMDKVGPPTEVDFHGSGVDAVQTVPPYWRPEVFPSSPLVAKDNTGWYYTYEAHTDTIHKGDATYPSGNYWNGSNSEQGRGEDLKVDGEEVGAQKNVIIRAPAERIPYDELPVQAHGDRWDHHQVPMPAAHTADELPQQVAKYFDQVNDRELSCVEDSTSEHCVDKECKVDDKGVFIMGNSRFPDAAVEAAMGGGRFRVRFGLDTRDSTGALGGEDCSQNACSVFRPCFDAAENQCYQTELMHGRDRFGTYISENRCKQGQLACNAVAQETMNFFKDGGKRCV